MNSLILASVAIVVFGILAYLEFRRANRRLLVVRISATAIAVSALAVLGIQAGKAPEIQSKGLTSATLLTPQLALKHAGREIRLPDVAFLRRHYPSIRQLTILGNGLEPWDFDVLQRIGLIFRTPEEATTDKPAIRRISYPRTVKLGEFVRIQGEVRGKMASTVHVDPPHGAEAVADVRNDDRFEIVTATPPAPGRYLWKVKVGDVDETIGIAVEAPDLPRVLTLESSPKIDTGRLRQWFSANGGQFLTRSLVSRDRYRFASSAPPAIEFGSVDEALLRKFDIVVMDDGALKLLAPTERDALERAVRDEGLGILIAIDSAARYDDFFLPWRLRRIETDGAGIRTTRLKWHSTVTQPVTVEDAEIVSEKLALVRDTQDRILAAAAKRGRGTVVATLVRDTWRWPLQNDPASFAEYWSRLLTAAARPHDKGNWSLVSGFDGPIFVDQPLELLWTHPSAEVGVLVGPDQQTARIEFAQDAANSSKWRAKFWPRKPGWYSIGQPAFSFYVSPADSWSAFQTARRTEATRQFAALYPAVGLEKDRHVASFVRSDAIMAISFVMFVLTAGFLWIERRLAWALP